MARISSNFYIKQGDYSDVVMYTDTSKNPPEVYTTTTPNLKFINFSP